MDYHAFLNSLKKNYKPEDLRLFEEAYKFASAAHEGQKRKSGEPYVSHALAVADYLGNHLHMDIRTLIAGLLHDVPEETSHTLPEIENKFGKEVARLVSGITKLGKIKLRNQKDENYIETLRKMFLAMAEDIRVVLIKLADRRHNMFTLQFLPKDKQQRIARETLEVYAPIANRLGMGELKGELEDLSFPHIYPGDYEWLTKLVKEPYAEMEVYVNRAKEVVMRDFNEAQVRYLDIRGRAKHLFSLYEKLLRPKYNRDLGKVYDLVALRIIAKNLEDCYTALGILHSKYRPLPGRIKDYIAFPKPNGYRSIHTTVFGPERRILEIQIRTEEMHQEAEYGIAAHWAYSEFGKPKSGIEALPQQLEWINQLKDWQKEIGKDPKEFIETLKIDFFKNRIFVFTPKGDVKDLPEGATALDFAFSVHTNLGLRAQGALVNSKIAKLSDELNNGDVVEILSAKSPKVSRDWLHFIKASNGRGKIRSYLNRHQTGWLGGLLPKIPFIKK